MFWLPVFSLLLPWLQTPLCFILTTLTGQVTSSSLYCYLGFLMEFTKPWKFPFFPFACNFPLVVKWSVFFSHLISSPPAGPLGCPLGFLSSTWVFAGADHLQRETVRQRGWRSLTHSCVSALSFRRCGQCSATALCEIGGGRWGGKTSLISPGTAVISCSPVNCRALTLSFLLVRTNLIYSRKKLLACKYFDEITGFC